MNCGSATRPRLAGPDLTEVNMVQAEPRRCVVYGLRKQGMKLKDLCARFSVSKACMSTLCSGKTFKHLPV